MCTNGTRVFVQRGVLERFEATVLERVKRIRVGAPTDADTNFGPLVSAVQLHKVLGYIESGKQEGARLWRAASVSPKATSATASMSSRQFLPTVMTTCASSAKKSSGR